MEGATFPLCQLSDANTQITSTQERKVGKREIVIKNERNCGKGSRKHAAFQHSSSFSELEKMIYIDEQ